uniref:Uncharacterized protein n=1 Tax=Arundo donax TaxID=35708 RepID=A0A0A9CFD0_ARUDO
MSVNSTYKSMRPMKCEA